MKGKTRGRSLPALLLSAALAGVLTACGAGPTTAPATPSTLTVGTSVGLTISSWLPIVGPSDCVGVNGPGALGPDTYKPLLWYANSGQLDLSRSLASGVSVSRNDTLYTITMNPKWHWSTGQPVTAQDAVYDIRLFIAASAPNTPYPYCFNGSGGVPTDWGKITVINSHKFTVQTTRPVNPEWFERNGLGQIVPVPQFSWDKYSSMTQELKWMSKVTSQPTNPIFSVYDGPYHLAKVVTNSYWEFLPNPHYDGAHKPAFKKVLWEYETSAQSTFLALKSGSVQVAQLPMTFYDSVLRLTKYRVFSPHLFGYQWLGLNFHAPSLGGTGPLIHDLYIRQALQLGIDQKVIIDKLNHGLGQPVYGPVPQFPKNGYYDYSMPNYYPYNPQRGRRILESHGWHAVSGVMQKNGVKLQFSLYYGAGTSTTVQDTFQVIASDWAKEGIRVTMYPKPLPQALVKNWAIGGLGDWFYAPDYFPTGGDLFASTGGINQAIGHYDSRTMNRLIQATYAPGTPAQVKQRMDAYQKYAAQNLPVLWMPVTPAADGFLYVVSNSLKGFRSHYDDMEAYVPYNLLN